jgi:hypothetical protein
VLIELEEEVPPRKYGLLVLRRGRRRCSEGEVKNARMAPRPRGLFGGNVREISM